MLYGWSLKVFREMGNALVAYCSDLGTDIVLI